MTAPNLPHLIIHNMKKLKQTTMLDNDGALEDGFLFRELRRYNLHGIFYPIFAKHRDNKELAVIKTAFVILAYSYNSTWINIDKDRYINKREILNSLCVDSEIEIDSIEADILLGNNDEEVNESISYYVESQKDEDFYTLLGLIEYISFCNKKAITTGESSTDRELSDRGKYLSSLSESEEKRDVVKKRIESKYMMLDEVMKKEGRVPISEQLDLSIYENRLLFINKKLKNGENI